MKNVAVTCDHNIEVEDSWTSQYVNYLTKVYIESLA